MKILITEPEYFPEKARKILESVGQVVAKRLNRQSLLKEVADTDILVIRIETKVDRKVLDAAQKLKIIASATTGLNHVDVARAKERGIKVINLHGIHTTPTAEHTIALMLALVRRLPWAFDNMRKGKWERYKFIGTQLSGKMLGIIGFGRIGKRVAELAKGFGMFVIASDPFIGEKEMQKLGVKKVDIDEALRLCDILTLHANLKDVKPIIGEKEFKKMKPGTLLINTARGELVDESALLNALKEGSVAGAALDVYSEEPLPASSPLVKYAKSHSNLLITPHIAASTREAVEEASTYIAKKVAKSVRTMA